MKLKITAFLTLGLLFDVISAQLSFFDQRYPPPPASRRQIVVQRNGGLTGRRSAALLQAPPEEQVSQQYEDTEQEQMEPLVQEPVTPTQPPQRPIGNGGPKPSVPRRPVSTFTRPPPPTRPPQQQREDFGQTLVGGEEGPDVQVSQRQDQGFTDITMDDVSTERGPTPTAQTFTSAEEEVTDDGFTPTEPEQRPMITTTRTTGQVKGNGNGRPRAPAPAPKGRNGLVPTGLQPVRGNGRKPTNGKGRKPTQTRDRRPITQVTDSGDAQVTDGQVSDGQISDGQISDGQIGGGQIGGGQVSIDDSQIMTGQRDDGEGAGIRDRIPSGIPGVSAPTDGHVEDHGDHHDHHSGDPIQWLRDAVRGEPGADYPIFYEPPETGFQCGDQQYPGYYADVEARCQVFHICQENGRSDAFLCPNGTIFSQQHFVCVWWHDFDCSTAPMFFQLNANLYSGQTAEAVAPQEPSTGVEELGFEEPAEPVQGPAAGPIGGPRTPGAPSTRPGGVSTRGRPGAGTRPGVGTRPGAAPRPGVQTPIDSEGFGPEEPIDERIQTGVEQQVDGQGPEEPQQYGQTEEPSLPSVTQTDGFDDTPGPMEVITTSRPLSFKAPNGRPPAGVKGVRKNGRRNGVTTPSGNGAKPKIDVTTTRPLPSGPFRMNGVTKKNGANGKTNGVPVSPADKGRNGKTRPNGSTQPMRVPKRPATGTKSVFRDRTSQRQDLDGQSSNRHWFYYLGL